MRTTTDGTGQDREHLPPMGRQWLLPLYDPLTRLAGAGRIHRRLVEAAGVQAGHRVLEIGCGTGNLALLVKERQPGAAVVGLDPDLPALARARRKALRRGLTVQWDVGSAAELPYPDGSVDRVFSCLMLHHLPDGEKQRALAEVCRVLRPDGELHLADFDGPHHASAGRLLHRRHQDPPLRGRPGESIADLLRGAGFADVVETALRTRFLGPLTAYRAAR